MEITRDRKQPLSKSTKTVYIKHKWLISIEMLKLPVLFELRYFSSVDHVVSCWNYHKIIVTKKNIQTIKVKILKFLNIIFSPKKKPAFFSLSVVRINNFFFFFLVVLKGVSFTCCLFHFYIYTNLNTFLLFKIFFQNIDCKEYNVCILYLFN